MTLLVNGLPLVHIELKRRGIDIREAFNQIRRYERESFWSGAGLFDYVQIFVISNGTLTKYYSNTTREQHFRESAAGTARRAGTRARTCSSFEFTSWWADARNRKIEDLTDFAPRGARLESRRLLNPERPEALEAARGNPALKALHRCIFRTAGPKPRGF